MLMHRLSGTILDFSEWQCRRPEVHLRTDVFRPGLSSSEATVISSQLAEMTIDTDGHFWPIQNSRCCFSMNSYCMRTHTRVPCMRHSNPA
jgi:hypothetical protein